ncbi:maleylacetate reductase [Cnuibacter sp. UC19_7]|uniref:maleylacetate reductase n=1 Tax=Cnuibacter sp. UC19_7 TaxID=3350166 RepID=UPI00366CF489
MRFDHRTLPQRVRFGTGSVAEALAAEIVDREARSVMVIASGREMPTARRACGAFEVALWWDEVTVHVPLELAERARTASRDGHIDLVIALGGGSAIGLAKAIALTERLPIVAVPTTYAGSEATTVWGLTSEGRKTTGSDDVVLPSTVVYDSELVTSLPAELAVASAMNAAAHCVDSMWAPRTDPLVQALAEEGLRSLGSGLSAFRDDPDGITAREELQFGAYVSGVAFSAAGSGLHHKICHVLGGAYDLPHAPLHTAVLPHVLAFNAPAAPQAEARIARALGSDSAVHGLRRLYSILPVTPSLAALGFTRDDIPRGVELILPVVPDSNPRPVTADDLTDLLTAAWEGQPAEGR